MIVWDEPFAFNSCVRCMDGEPPYEATFELQVGIFEDERFLEEKIKIEGFWGPYGSPVYLEWIGPSCQVKLQWRFGKNSPQYDLVLATCVTKVYQPIIDLISEQETRPIPLAVLARLHELLRQQAK